jgi:hypothetical protein
MIFEDILRDLLVSFNLVDNRVFLLRAPQSPASQAVTPYLVFLPVGPEPLHAHSGPVALVREEYQFSIFDTSQSRALALAASLRQRLDGLRGDFEGVTFGGVFYRSKTTSYEDDTRLFQAIVSYFIQCRVPDSILARESRQQQQRQQQRQYALKETTKP